MDPVETPVPAPTGDPPTTPSPIAAPTSAPPSPASKERKSITSCETLTSSGAATAKTSTLKATSAPFTSFTVSGLSQTLSSVTLAESSSTPLDMSSSTNQSKRQLSIRHGTSSTYISPTHAESQRLSRLYSNASHLSVSNSPFFPKTLNEFVEHQKLYAEDIAMEGKEKLANMIAEAESGVPKVMPFLHGARKEVRDRILGDGRSAVLGVPSIWTVGGTLQRYEERFPYWVVNSAKRRSRKREREQWADFGAIGTNPKPATTAGLASVSDSKVDVAKPGVKGAADTTKLKATPTLPNPSEGTAAWPSAVEFKLHGEDRIKKYGKKAQRTLPVPVNSQWVPGEVGYERKIWEYSDLDKVALCSPVTGASVAGKWPASNAGGAGMSGFSTGFNAGSANMATGGVGSSFNTGFNPNTMAPNNPHAHGMGGTFNPGFNPNNMAASSGMGNTFNAGFHPNTIASPHVSSTGMGGNFNQGYNPSTMYSSNTSSTNMGNTYNTHLGNGYSSFNSDAPTHNQTPSSGPVVPANVSEQFMPIGNAHNPFLIMTRNETPILTMNEHGQYIFNYANSATGYNMPGGAVAEYNQDFSGQQGYSAGGIGAGQMYGGAAGNVQGQGFAQGQAQCLVQGGCAGMYPAGHGHPRDQPRYSAYGEAGVGGRYAGAPSIQIPTTAGVPLEVRAQSFGPFGAGEDDEEPPEGGWVFDEEWMRANGNCLEVLDAINKKK